jgi:hypothetical protein
LTSASDFVNLAANDMPLAFCHFWLYLFEAAAVQFSFLHLFEFWLP